MPDQNDQSSSPSNGVVFPADEHGVRSSTATVREIFARAAAAADPALARRIRGEKAWRASYVEHLADLAQAAAKCPDSAMHIAQAGLAAAHESLVFLRAGGEFSLPGAMQAFRKPRFHTGIVRGTADAIGPPEVRYRDRTLRGAALLAQVADWERRGIVEKSFADAIRHVTDDEDLRDLRGRHIVLLGANAELSPLQTLLGLGATVIAIDVPRPGAWLHLFDLARRSPGTLIFPLRSPAPKGGNDQALSLLAGADLIAEAPEMRTWLSTFRAPLTIGTLAYLDGSRHVLVSMAMDAIVADIAAERADTGYAVMLTPTDVYVVPDEVASASLEKSKIASAAGLFTSAVRIASGEHLFARNVRALVDCDNGRRYGVVDSQLVQQGPAYALAKSIQRWRAMVMRAGDRRVSANVAAATRTRSVVSNRLFAAAYRGCEVFGVEAFDPPTNRALMALALVHDLNGMHTAANPAQPLAHPLELFMDTANHGGFWRIAYQVRSALAPAVVAGWGLGLRQKADPVTAGPVATGAPLPGDSI